jgi:hypothetical protein
MQTDGPEYLDEYPIAPGGGTSDIDTKYPLAMDDDLLA